MIRHVIMWKFKEGEQEKMHEFLGELSSLRGQIPQIVDMEVGVDYGVDGNFDAVLISTFRSREDLEAYKIDPRHMVVAKKCSTIRTDRVAVDFEF